MSRRSELGGSLVLALSATNGADGLRRTAAYPSEFSSINTCRLRAYWRVCGARHLTRNSGRGHVSAAAFRKKPNARSRAASILAHALEPRLWEVLDVAWNLCDPSP